MWNPSVIDPCALGFLRALNYKSTVFTMLWFYSANAAHTLRNRSGLFLRRLMCPLGEHYRILDSNSKSIDLLWDAVVAVATHSASVPQTYPPRPQHAHNSPARIHNITEPRLSITLLLRRGPYLNMRSAFN